MIILVCVGGVFVQRNFIFIEIGSSKRTVNLPAVPLVHLPPFLRRHMSYLPQCDRQGVRVGGWLGAQFGGCCC